MKLTSEKKSLRQSRKSLALSNCQKQVYECCASKPVSLSKTATRNNNNSRLELSNQLHYRNRDPFIQLLNWQCKTILSRVNQNSQLLSEVIICVLKALMPKNRKIREKMYNISTSSSFIKGYTRGLGWICAQVSSVYKNKDQSVNTIIKILQLSDFDKEKKISYGKAALKHHLGETPSHFQQIIANINVQPLILRYLDSLLFQFIPAEYTKFILDLYLHEYQELLGNPSEWENQPRPKQFFKVMCSLIHYILMMKKPINQQHFQYMCANSYMGVVQWPIVISNRSLFEYPERTAGQG